jgi:uncharacterized membrane protein YphA (DoxX/SURF4 family)
MTELVVIVSTTTTTTITTTQQQKQHYDDNHCHQLFLTGWILIQQQSLFHSSVSTHLFPVLFLIPTLTWLLHTVLDLINLHLNIIFNDFKGMWLPSVCNTCIHQCILYLTNIPFSVSIFRFCLVPSLLSFVTPSRRSFGPNLYFLSLF